MIRLTTTGSRAWGRCPAPASTTSEPPVSSAIRVLRAAGWQRSSSPNTVTTGQRTRRSTSSAKPGGGVGSARWQAMFTSGPLSSIHSTTSSSCRVECGSGSSCPAKKAA